MRFQSPRGTEDVLPSQAHRWHRLEDTFRELAHQYGYSEIRTPTFEDYDLFVRSSGETSEVVSKQMYDFIDKGERHIALKPEGTAPAMRAVIEHNLCPPGAVQRLYYITPFFRYERPQKGRLREAHQAGLELIGSPSAAADAEIIEITMEFYRRIGMPNTQVLINSIGRSECRERFRGIILEHMADWLAEQPEEVRAKAHKNPLRLLDSKDPAVQERLKTLPPVLECLEPESRERFDELQRLLTEAGVNYRVAPEIVRGLDYYTETVFEVQSTDLGGSQNALCGGGRYDNLIKELGGSDTPSVGVGIGLERALIVLEAQGVEFESKPLDAFVVYASVEFFKNARDLARGLRADGCSAVMDLDGKSMKSQLKQADKSGARYALIIGEDEVNSGTVTLRNLAGSDQRPVPLTDVVREVRS